MVLRSHLLEDKYSFFLELSQILFIVTEYINEIKSTMIYYHLIFFTAERIS